MESPPSTSWFDQVTRLYARLEVELAPHQHLCELSGVCCDFRKSTHRLYATELEVRYALEHRARRGEELPIAEEEQLCPFWRGGLCRARAERPLGCRTYFCAPSWRGIGEAIYERCHAELQKIGEQHGIPYRYAPWVEQLREARPTPTTLDPSP